MLNSLIYYPSKDHIDTPANHNIIHKDIVINSKYHGWLIIYPVKEKPTFINNKYILFLHGNAGNISYRMHYIIQLNKIGFNILIIDYPGFGLSKGIPNKKENSKCASLFLKYLVNTLRINPDNIIIFGESIGGYFAIELANQYNMKYLILQSTFTDINNLIRDKYMFGILTKYIRIGYNNMEQLVQRHRRNKIDKKLCTMVIHSKEDEIIPFNHFENLSKYSTDKYECRGLHSTPELNSEYINNIINFIN
jgi:esterase/lipase